MIRNPVSRRPKKRLEKLPQSSHTVTNAEEIASTNRRACFSPGLAAANQGADRPVAMGIGRCWSFAGCPGRAGMRS
jgi:hypothetical protein